MPVCEECGERYETLENACRYCDDGFCPRHRLPENHDCPGLDDASIGSKHFASSFDDSVNRRGTSSETNADGESDAPRPMESVPTYGGSGKSPGNTEFDSGPDVGRDGSIAGEETDPEQLDFTEPGESYSTWKIVLLILFVAACSWILAFAL